MAAQVRARVTPRSPTAPPDAARRAVDQRAGRVDRALKVEVKCLEEDGAIESRALLEIE